LGMRERVAQCNGVMDILSHPGEGTRIRIVIPLEETCDE
jgi:signal transduction histidine kinase